MRKKNINSVDAAYQRRKKKKKPPPPPPPQKKSDRKIRIMYDINYKSL